MGRRRGRAAAEARAHWRHGPVIPVHESEIEQAGEHQWVAAVLWMHGIGGGKQCGWLLTAARGCGGGPARSCARGGKMLWTRSVWASKESRGATAKHVLRPGEMLHTRAGAVNAGGTRGGSGGGGATLRGEEEPARAGQAAARTQGRHGARGKAARGRRVRGTWPAKRRGWARAKTEEPRAGGR
jgi:hypothetical protein